jgi:hypothetical protein
MFNGCLVQKIIELTQLSEAAALGQIDSEFKLRRLTTGDLISAHESLDDWGACCRLPQRCTTRPRRN